MLIFGVLVKLFVIREWNRIWSHLIHTRSIFVYPLLFWPHLHIPIQVNKLDDLKFSSLPFGVSRHNLHCSVENFILIVFCCLCVWLVQCICQSIEHLLIAFGLDMHLFTSFYTSNNKSTETTLLTWCIVIGA